MSLFKLQLHFNLFDDGGGEGGESGSVGNGLDSAEARGFMKSIGMTDESIATGNDGQSVSSDQQIEYGLPPESDANEDIGNPQSGEEGSSLDATEGQDLESEFAKLVGKDGKFKDIYGQKVADAINQRFKNQSDAKGQMDGLSTALAPLLEKYGVDINDTEGLTKAIQNDEDLWTAAADREGMTVEQYQQQQRLEAEAKYGRELREEMARQEQERLTYERWDAEAAELAESVPGFDIDSEMQNEEFVGALERTGSVKDAFLLAHAADIFSGAMAQQQQQTQREMVANINQKSERPVENGTQSRAAVVRKTDPSKFTNEDIDRILARVAKGESIRF